MKIAKVFANEDGKTVWSHDTENGSELHSVGVDVRQEGFDIATGNITVDRNIVWFRGNDIEVVQRQQQAIVDLVNAGKMRAYRQFSETPFYEGQEQDINPSTQESLGRYSQAKMCLTEDYAKLHKQYVVNTVATPAPVAQPTVGTEQA